MIPITQDAQKLSPEELEQWQQEHEAIDSRLKEEVVKAIREIAADAIKRKEGYLKDPSLLDAGIFYPYEYYCALMETGQQEKISAFKEQDFFFHGVGPLEYFDHVSDESYISGKLVNCLVVKEGVLPSDALKALKRGLCVLGCGEAVQIAQYRAIKKVLKKDKFNALFAAGTKKPLTIGKVPNNPIYSLRHNMNERVSASTAINLGDHLFVENDSYIFKHPLGSCAGFNVICVDDTPGQEKFTGLGLPPDGITLDQLYELFAVEYNLPPKSLDRLSEKTKDAYLSVIGPDFVSRMESLKDATRTVAFYQEPAKRKVLLLNEIDSRTMLIISKISLEKMLSKEPL